MDAVSLVGILAGTPAEEQPQVLHAALAAKWQAQLAERLAYYTQDTLARVRASQDLAQAVMAVTPLLQATVWISPEWPDGDAADE